MEHLETERLADLVDGPGTAADRDHLASCAVCAAELASYRRVVSMAADERRRIAPPLTNWDTLANRVREEGLVATKPVARRRSSVALLARRAAAIVVFTGTGVVMGRMSTGLSVAQAVVSGWRVGGSPADASGIGVAPVPGSAVFSSAQDALAELERAQTRYERAAAYLATHDTSTAEAAADEYRTRLAALDRNAATLIQALNESPQDPVINQIYLATLGAREATLNKLGSTLPVGVRLARF